MSGRNSPSPAPSKASISSILDTAEAQWKPSSDSTKSKLFPKRPSTSTRPSWIGPKAPVTPGLHAMLQPVTLSYTSPGLEPPVYAFTSLSSPQWESVEMDAQKNESGEWQFTKSFSAEPGEYQYKFRLGPGEWWALDDKQQIVDDGFGNKNNSLVVQEPVAEKHTETAAPLMSHEALPEPALKPVEAPAPASENKEVAHVAPLMPHEEVHKPAKPEDAPDYAWNGDGEDEDPDSSPLMRHESFGPDSAEQTHSPLFRHETVALGEHKDDTVSRHSPSKVPGTPFAQEADPHDPSLEKFPSDHHGILEKIHRTTTHLAADETTEATVGSPTPSSKAMSDGEALSPVSSLPSVKEDQDEELERLHEIEEEEVEREEKNEEFDPLRPAGPMTPPMTPKEEQEVIKEEQEMVSDVIAGVMMGETVDEAIEEAMEREIVKEEVIEAMEDDRKEAIVEEDGQEIPQTLIEEKSGLAKDVMSSPVTWVVVFGVGIAIAAVGGLAYTGKIPFHLKI